MLRKVKRICMVIDVEGWAYHNIAKQIAGRISYSRIITLNNLISELNKKTHRFVFDIYIHFNLYNTNYIFNKIKKENHKAKHICFIYNNFTWKENFFMKNIRIMDKLFVSSEKIYKNILNKIKYKPTGFCIDGVDEKLFKFSGYNEDLFTKEKLIVGWIGNSDIKENGRLKGFSEIKNTINDISNNFIFKPLDKMEKYIPHTEVPDYLKDIDIIVCFSVSEGTPNQILEASSSGKCWISTDVGIVSLLQNTIPDNDCGIIIERKGEKLKENLEYLNKNRELIKKYGENGRRAILKRFTWDIRANAIIKNILN